MKLSPKTIVNSLIITCFLFLNEAGFTQDKEMIDKVSGRMEYDFQQMTEENALGDVNTLRQFIADSLKFIYDERYQQELDSLESNYITTIKALETECTRLNNLNKALTDSLEKSVASKPKSVILTKELDPALEARYFQYGKILRLEESKRKAGFLKMSAVIENIAPFQIEELNRYYDQYFPIARSDSALDFIIQINIREKDWSNAGRNIIKFLYLFPNSALYDEIKTVRAGIFQTEKYYQSYRTFLTDLLNKIPQLPLADQRYYQFVESLKDFPDPTIRTTFIPEVHKFLELYPNSRYATQANFWIAEALLANNQPHSAYLTLQKIMILYPNNELYCRALHTSGVIQQEQFGEYKNAIQTFTDLIKRFPQDTLAENAHYRIAKISDENLNDWELAVEQYQIYADKYPQSPNAIPALMRKAVIQSTQMNLIEEAVRTYKSIDERYPSTIGAFNALTAAGNLYTTKERYDQAIEIYMSIFQKYPQSENAVAALEKVYDIYQTKIKDNEKSIEILNLIINNYPDTKASARATKQLKKFEKAQ
ncbi:MAG TPA: tetratricopeptide repeat protein [Candidatus Marinimicrobia bacterium]|nr:tetratricopeptide repeat protein [Candidatus Neomarinimicrobiota bacterium]HQE96076.1 tetratricopeptide repeat protein [Candidatus Neomarinimicrobiota bacterium]HQH56907.1 tetratricopeptide repeat protein [Candidatus Neomarinimicrobiota bacterium]HQK12230.1 tetratricopeptide repeat protein [Candidatus Neomarinimicrobiota bacterium]